MDTPTSTIVTPSVTPSNSEEGEALNLLGENPVLDPLTGQGIPLPPVVLFDPTRATDTPGPLRGQGEATRPPGICICGRPQRGEESAALPVVEESRRDLVWVRVRLAAASDTNCVMVRQSEWDRLVEEDAAFRSLNDYRNEASHSSSLSN